MSGNRIGRIFSVSTFGESHGKGIGALIDGCPAGVKIQLDLIHNDLQRRKPGQSRVTTQRNEDDGFEILSGTLNGLSTGAPIAIWIPNKDQRSKDYDSIKHTFRPSHADYTYYKKYGIRDHRGGGRSSARETAARVAAGAIAKSFLNEMGVTITAYVSSVGEISIGTSSDIDLQKIEENIVRCPSPSVANRMIKLIEEVKAEGDSVGGIISCVISGVPAGVGEPVFDRLHANLGKAMLSINASKGFEIGSGFTGTQSRGSIHNDLFTIENDQIFTKTNHSGGIQGGISNGMPITFNVAFKPVSTIMKDQETINEAGDQVTINPKGRHDPCVVPRAVPIVEAMAALVIADNILLARTNTV